MISHGAAHFLKVGWIYVHSGYKIPNSIFFFMEIGAPI
jgi:hypothetical protein